MKTEKAIEFIETLEGETVYFIEVIDGKVSPGVYNPIILDGESLDYLVDGLIENEIEFTRWEYRDIRDFEHYVVYFKNLN